VEIFKKYFLMMRNVRYKPKNIFAYEGLANVRLAMLKGEVNMGSESSAGYNGKVVPFVKQNQLMPLYSTGLLNEEGNTKPEPAVKNIITVEQLYNQLHKTAPSGPAWEAFKVLVGVAVTGGKGILFPPGTEAQAQIVADACVKMNADPAFQKDIAKIAKGNPVIVGDELVGFWKAAFSAAKPEVITWLRDLLKTEYGVAFE